MVSAANYHYSREIFNDDGAADTDDDACSSVEQ